MGIQIFGTKKNFDTKKAERFFKERRIPYQFVDLGKHAMGLKELESVARQVGVKNMIALSDKDWQSHYISQLTDMQAALEALRDHPKLLKTPVVRNGKLATIGFQPDVWAQWK